MGWPGVAGRSDTLDPALKVNVSACPVHDSKQQFLGFGSVTFAIFSPKRRHKGEGPGEMRPPRWNLHQGWGWLRVGADSLPRTAPVRPGRVLQTFVGAQESFAVRAVMVHVLQGVHTEGDEAAACYAPGRTQTAPRRIR